MAPTRYLRSSASRDVNPDLDIERKTPSFDVEKLTTILDGGAENTRVRRAVEAVIHSDPVFSREDKYFLSQNESYEAAVKKAVHLKKMMHQMKWSWAGSECKYCNRALGGEVAFTLHNIFMESILALSTDEQTAKWIPLAENYRILGSYAQTELGHGTYIRGFETTATFNISTQEFVLNTPKISAMKWWPGDLGRSATHTVVFAQLYIKGKCYGVHPFIVQIRSLHDHSPAPGVTVGDIGPKMDFNHIDNGYLLLQDVRVPRENMLSRFCEVLADGTYVKRGSEKINYFNMIIIRVKMLSNEVVPTLMKACTIAIRYSVVRRQSELMPGDQEAKILDYQTQQQKLLPVLAIAYAFHFMNEYMNELFSKGYREIKQKNFDSLPELHAFSSGLKAIVTEHSTAGVETCRKACGGHGYSLLSGLPSLYTRLAASCTYEGENTVLLLQTARFLVKCLGAARSGQPVPPSVAYLSAVNSERCLVRDKRDLLQPDVYVEAYRHVAIRVLSSAAAKLQALVQSGAEQHEAWHQCTVQLVHAAKAHCHYHVVKSFAEAVEKLGQEAGIQRIMKHLCGLFALHGIFSNTGDFLHDGYISGDQVDMMTASYLDLLAIVRKDAVPLVDAFDFTDETLNSALGSYDGHVYRRLYQWARKSPSNTKQANQVYENYLKPLFQNGLSKL
ncbi:PREDICTED: peroxisomal acyl-coenzyme A oxidase 2 isoform X1 [Crocodylus porosus]|uniref:Acyl-coenzyme A oxidase n=1 Tax=Crocodylus porosus TaxID=8502 RepID=A0A7M4FG36_CROPO|nr:PREDICTED: peroxisomal acyl-coenzyme A oxidase 2 isoform X1 [Crocodylus porosus]XP_019392297.1 PREDICTED: peroxisomal acyl-coenzyme A oxidase 2 isoform X1 [Crocodylus porosus]